MARFSKFRSPEKLANNDKDEQSESNNNAAAEMGNNNSSIDMNVARHTAYETVRARIEAQNGSARPSTGKLTRPSLSVTATTNPAYRNPVPTSAKVQKTKKLGATNKSRKSPYEDIDGDAGPDEVPPPGIAAWSKEAPAFSPTKAQRREAKQVQVEQEGHVDVVQEATADTPRRSTRQHEPNTQEVETDARHRDYFPDEVVRRHAEVESRAPETRDAEEEIKAQAEVDDDDIIEVSNVDPKATVDAVPPPRKRGRPSKKSIQAATPTLQQKKPGEKPTRQSTRGRDSGPSEPATVPQKRAQQLASQSPQKRKTQSDSPREPTAKRLRREMTQPPNAELEKEVLEGEEGHDELAGGEDGIFEPDGAGDASPRRPTVRRGGPVLTNSEVVFENDGDYQNAGDDQSESEEERGSTEEPDGEPASQPQSQRSKKKTASANTGRRRATLDRAADQDDQEGESSAAGANATRMFGQWRALHEIYLDLQHVGCNVRKGLRKRQNAFLLQDEDVEPLMKLCEKATNRFTSLKDGAGSDEPDRSPGDVLEKIKERVDGLRGLNEEYPTDFDDRTKSTEIYFHLIPGLVRLARHSILCYEAIDKDDPRVSDGHITIDHLRTVNKILRLILDLESGAQEYKRPEPSSHVVQPVHNGIVVPLRPMHAAFARHIKQHDHAISSQRRRESTARNEALLLEQEERRSIQEAQNNSRRKKWEKLHDARMYYEGPMMKPRKRSHLQMPDSTLIEIDQDGLPFERTEVFIPRIGPPPSLVEAAISRVWSLVETSTLIDGLREYSGDEVFEKIFWKFCGRGGVLNRFNVTEIVVVAAALRETLMVSQGKGEGGVENWVKGIPVWTCSHMALGKENEEREREGTGDLTGEE